MSGPFKDIENKKLKPKEFKGKPFLMGTLIKYKSE